MIESLIGFDQELLLLVNGLSGNGLVDAIMVAFSSKWFAIPIYAYLAFRIFREHSLTTAFWAVLAVVGVLVLTDQGSVKLFKEVLERSRPCHVPELKPLLNMLKGCGGEFGFISSHAANVFGFAAVVPNLVKNLGPVKWLLFLWAFAVALSRVYLGVHYPGDVLFGALFGGLVGIGVGRIAKSVIYR